MIAYKLLKLGLFDRDDLLKCLLQRLQSWLTGPSILMKTHTLVEARRRKELPEEIFLGSVFDIILVRANMVAVKERGEIVRL